MIYFRVASFKQPPQPQILTKSKNLINQPEAKSLKFILGFGLLKNLISSLSYDIV